MVKEPIAFIYIFYPGTTQKEIRYGSGFDYPNRSSISEEQKRKVIMRKNKILFEVNYNHDEIEFQDINWVETSKPKMLRHTYQKLESSIFSVSKNKNPYILWWSSTSDGVSLYPLNVQEINRYAAKAMKAAIQKGVPKPKLEFGTLDLKL